MLALVLGALSCKGGLIEAIPEDCKGPDFAGAPLGIRCGALVDSDGRQVWLHGVNARVEGIFDVTFDDGRKPLEPLPGFTKADAEGIRSLGFNAIRLPINWSGLEPTETGGFVESYLDKVAVVVGLARQAELYVLLDMHQDAYSKEIGEDGAPYWAISPPPPEKLGGPLTDLDARRKSKPVADAFETFFGTSDEGRRLRARFAKAAARVAARFADEPLVIGLELFNEPVTSDARLVDFHAEVIPAVRAAAPKKLIFFEPSAVRNILDKAPLATGSLGPGTVYAPHIYTFAFTGTEASNASITKESLRPSNEAARAEADAWEAPLVIGEYGFSPRSARWDDYITWQQDLQNEVRAHSFLWLWKEDSQGSWGVFDRTSEGWKERETVVRSLTRLRLQKVAGKLTKMNYDRPTQRLTFSFEGREGGSAANVVSVGRLSGEVESRCNGRSIAAVGSGPLIITCGGKGTHEVSVGVK